MAKISEIDDAKYEDLTIAERIDGLRLAREAARDDDQRGWMLVPYEWEDPRYDAYLFERNTLRVAAGKTPFRDPRTRKEDE